MAISLYTPGDVLAETCARFKALRLAQGLTQDSLAARSGVSLGSLKRFERTGQINFDSLLRLAMALGRLDAFQRFAESLVAAPVVTLDDLDRMKSLPKRGRR